MNEVVSDVLSWLQQLGGLHDVTVESATYEASGNRLVLEIADLNWDNEGLPDYRPRPCRLVFSAVQAFSVSAGQDRFHTSITGEGAHIADAHSITRDGVTRVDFVMSTSEHWYVEFGVLEIEDIVAQ